MTTKPAELTLQKHHKTAKEIFSDQRMIILFCIAGMVVFCTLFNSKFLTLNNIIQIFGQVSVVGMLTMGMAMLLLSGGFDLSIGNILGLAGCVMSLLITGSQAVTASGTVEGGVEVTARDAVGYTSVPVAIIIGLLVALGCGALNGVIVAKSKCVPLIITLGMSQVYYGLALWATDGVFMSFKMAFEPLRLLRVADTIPVTLFIFLGVVVLTYVLVNRTKYGRRIVAIGGNEENARLSGIKVDRYKIITYAISGLFCGVAAIVYASRLDAITASAGSGYELDALTGAMIGGVTFDGGKGTILGAFLGCLFMGVLNNVMNILGATPAVKAIIIGAVVVIAVIISNLDNLREK